MRAIGLLMGVTESWISQLNRRALRMLREEIGEII